MSDFSLFSKAVHARFIELSKGELFAVNLTGDQLWDAYQAAFPEGTNPIFRQRPEHDCSCCRNFIRNLGNVVAIVDGGLVSVWSLLYGLPHPYDVVAEKMCVLVEGASISSVFRSEFKSYGAEATFEAVEGGDPIKWNHFHGEVAKQHLFGKNTASVIGAYNTSVEMLERALNELKSEAVHTVIDLIAEKALYRGEEFLHMVLGFKGLALGYEESGRSKYFIWTSAEHTSARIRNTSIGTLLVDLSEGMPLEQAVAAFEKKVAPENYRRPTALITKSMIDSAMGTIAELGLEPSLQRRHAVIGDISINDVIWANNWSQQHMKNPLTDLLMEAVKTPAVDTGDATNISIDDFMSIVVPTAKSMGVLVKNSQQNNLVSLTAPVVAGAEPLFKWDNGFAWSYNGNIADSSLRKAVQSRGGRVDGVFRFSHSWNHEKRNASLMDLHVFMPGCEHKSGTHCTYGSSNDRVGWNRSNDRHSGGIQDVDYTHEAPAGYVPVENITFPSLDRLKDGEYKCKIHNWQLRAPNQGGFKAEIEFGGQVFEYEYDKPLAHHEWVDVATVTLKAGVFTIEHHLPTTTSQQTVWGIQTEQFTEVDTLMYSPNFWDGATQIGNKHWFFMLKGCANPEPVRGIYNEYLRSDLDKHRKVFEVLGSKTMCPPVMDQLSGVGFSSTRGDTVVVKVTAEKSTRLYNVQF